MSQWIPFEFLLCLRELQLSSFLSKSISCLSLQNVPWIWPLLPIFAVIILVQTTTVSCLDECKSLLMSPISFLAPLQTIPHPAGQVILDKCQSDHVTSSGFSLHPYSLFCFTACSVSVYPPTLFHATSPYHCASATLPFFLFLKLIKLIISSVSLHLPPQVFA